MVLLLGSAWLFWRSAPAFPQAADLPDSGVQIITERGVRVIAAYGQPHDSRETTDSSGQEPMIVFAAWPKSLGAYPLILVSLLSHQPLLVRRLAQFSDSLFWDCPPAKGCTQQLDGAAIQLSPGTGRQPPPDASGHTVTFQLLLQPQAEHAVAFNTQITARTGESLQTLLHVTGADNFGGIELPQSIAFDYRQNGSRLLEIPPWFQPPTATGDPHICDQFDCARAQAQIAHWLTETQTGINPPPLLGQLGNRGPRLGFDAAYIQLASAAEWSMVRTTYPTVDQRTDVPAWFWTSPTPAPDSIQVYSTSGTQEATERWMGFLAGVVTGVAGSLLVAAVQYSPAGQPTAPVTPTIAASRPPTGRRRGRKRGRALRWLVIALAAAEIVRRRPGLRNPETARTFVGKRGPELPPASTRPDPRLQ
jgi:hypothetical protein